MILEDDDMENIIFVIVESKLKGFGVGKGVKHVFDNIEEIINEKLEDGYTYLGYVPVEFRGTGDMTKMKLIFKKE